VAGKECGGAYAEQVENAFGTNPKKQSNITRNTFFIVQTPFSIEFQINQFLYFRSNFSQSNASPPFFG